MEAMSTIDLLKLMAEGGSLALLTAVLYGGFRLTREFAPQFLAAWNAQTTALTQLSAKIDAQGATQQAMLAQVLAKADMLVLQHRNSEVDPAEITGRHQAVAAGTDLEHQLKDFVRADPTRKR